MCLLNASADTIQHQVELITCATHTPQHLLEPFPNNPLFSESEAAGMAIKNPTADLAEKQLVIEVSHEHPSNPGKNDTHHIQETQV
jgi:hypothetical protein